ncbi:unnamed protein product [Cuscuta epithymum]|uniref:Uncharacterized protein n=1 Tax=Cuscuta epithymum TaxID=186058 RepID=A0AAV0FG30_9ASTE|nr:unnamed protein product [Cuscuta epithymum]
MSNKRLEFAIEFWRLKKAEA